ncbi:DUF3540 domain-containing protein [Ralstonia sp. UBA689]|uniref:DUF3540 domain-containing protein n=1 Tax=Ralstonia sp. UBA689 TaxID=1947373 RepID=UPI0025CEC18B|nr:DUF3540 domain-containing protein [Ralstonia sp. UBA689]
MQSNLISISRPGHDHPVGVAHALVTGRAGQWFFVSTADASVDRALRADSCLIEPGCGDTVLVCHGGEGGVCGPAYILAVLAGADSNRATLALPGGVAMHSEAGALQVEAARIGLSATDSLDLAAQTVAMSGMRGDLAFHRLHASIQETHARLGVVSTIAHHVTSTVGRLVQKARDSFRWTENVDETRAGRMRLQVKERLHMSAQDAALLAERQVKVDGKTIDLG